MNGLLAAGAALDGVFNLRIRPKAVTGPPGTEVFELSRGAILRYRRSGDEPFVVMIPDPPNVIEHYDETVGALAAQGFGSLVIEHPGFGFSRRPPGGITSFEAGTDAIASVLDQLGTGPVTVAFGCVPAYIGNLLAQRRPDLVSSVVVMQAPNWEQELGWVKRVDRNGLVTTPLLGQALVFATRKRLAKRWYDVATSKSDIAPRFTEIARSAYKRGAVYGLATALQRMVHFPPPALSQVSIPSVAVWGLRDRSHRVTDRRTSAELIAQDARIVEWEDTGHFPELEQPKRFAELVKELVPT